MTFTSTAASGNAQLFSERDFETLAASIDNITPSQRELFLTKLVILLAADAPSGALQERIHRASRNLTSTNEETK